MLWASRTLEDHLFFNLERGSSKLRGSLVSVCGWVATRGGGFPGQRPGCAQRRKSLGNALGQPDFLTIGVFKRILRGPPKPISAWSQYRIDNPAKLYTCGTRHLMFYSFWKCHCNNFSRAAYVAFSIGDPPPPCPAFLNT